MNKKVGERVIFKRSDQCWTSGEIICIKDPYVKVRWKENNGAIARKTLHFSFIHEESLNYHVEKQQQPIQQHQPFQQQQQPVTQQQQPVTQQQQSVSQQQLEQQPVQQNHHLKLIIFFLLFGSLVYVFMDHYNFIYHVKAIEAAAHQNIKCEASFWDFGSSWRKANRCAKLELKKNPSFSIFQVLIDFLRKFVKLFIEAFKSFSYLTQIILVNGVCFCCCFFLCLFSYILLNILIR